MFFKLFSLSCTWYNQLSFITSTNLYRTNDTECFMNYVGLTKLPQKKHGPDPSWSHTIRPHLTQLPTSLCFDAWHSHELRPKDEFSYMDLKDSNINTWQSNSHSDFAFITKYIYIFRFFLLSCRHDFKNLKLNIRYIIFLTNQSLYSLF